MKKSLYFVAAAAILFSACSNEDEVTTAVENNGSVAVAFNPYLAQTTRAIPVEITKLKSDGFGVFAYEQGTTQWDTYRSSNVYPNFFYNQKVSVKSGETAWTYEPVKYFSNNIGALHSFFVYAPYNASVNAIFSMANDAPVIRYTAKDDYDLLYAEAIKDKVKPGVNTKLSFQFKHALSKVSFDVAPFIDEVHGGTSHTDGTVTASTTITVRSVKFIGKVPSQGLLNLGSGEWTLEATEEGAYEITKPVTFDASNSARQDLISNMMVIPTPTSDKVKIKVVYDVITTDAANPKNNSTVTNTVTSTEEFTLAKGTAYKFHLDLGMTTVKFTADVDVWGSETQNNVDLLNNLYAGLTYCTCPSAATYPASPAVGDYYYNTTDNKYYYCSTAGFWDTPALTTTTIYYNSADGKFYDNIGLTGTTVTFTSGDYYVINNLLYKAN